MKKIMLCLVWITICYTGQTQTRSNKNELGLNLYGLEIDVNYLGDGLYQPYYVNGLQYKRQFAEQYKFRVSGQYFTRDVNEILDLSESSEPSIQTWNYTTSTVEVRGGVDHTFFATSKITPFIFADLAYRQSHDKGVSKGSSRFGDRESEIDRKGNRIGAIGGLGIQYSPIPSIYIGIETSIGRYWGVGKQSITNSDVTYFSPVKTLVCGVQF